MRHILLRSATFNMENGENKYKNGDFVVEKMHPSRKLVIRRYVDRIYYCRDTAVRDGNDLVFFERELLRDTQSSTYPV
jgi:hypothetical protein